MSQISAQSASRLKSQFRQAQLHNDYPQALELISIAQQKHPEILYQLTENSSFFRLESLQAHKAVLDSLQVQSLLGLYHDLTQRTGNLSWQKEAGLAVIAYQSVLPDSLMPVLYRCLGSWHEMPPLFLESYAEACIQLAQKDELDLIQLSEIFWFLEDIWINAIVLFPSRKKLFAEQQLRLAQALQTMLPDCREIRRQYELSLRQDILNPYEYHLIYTYLRLKGCAPDDFRLAVLDRLPELNPDPYTYRIVAREYEESGEYLKALQLLEACIRIEKRPQILAQDYLRLAENYKRRKNFRTAQVYALRAHEAWPDWGKAWLFMADMTVEASPFCNFEGLERKALYWLATDYCERAMSLNPDLEVAAVQRIQKYQSQMPSAEEVSFYGLELGEAFPIRCWLETTTRVRYP